MWRWLRRLLLFFVCVVGAGGTFLFLRLKVLELRQERYVFVDGGAHLGETITDFRLSLRRFLYPWDVYSFEANPALVPRIARFPHVTVLGQAIWIEDGSVEFYVAETTPSSSILSTKQTGGLAKVPIRVPSIDFGAWLRRNFTQEDFLLVKLDIEGAEYEVLEQMLRDGSVDLVDEFLIEFHNRKVGISAERDAAIVAALRQRGITVATAFDLPSGGWFWP